MNDFNPKIISEHRRGIFNHLFSVMEKGRTKQEPRWNAEVLCPQNPFSQEQYKGTNRLLLMETAIEREYQDPRWLTEEQARKMGAHVIEGEQGVTCESWKFFEKEKYIDPETGQEEIKFYVFDEP